MSATVVTTSDPTNTKGSTGMNHTRPRKFAVLLLSALGLVAVALVLTTGHGPAMRPAYAAPIATSTARPATPPQVTTAPAPAAAQPAATRKAPTDPYVVYLAHAPRGAVYPSREDAQTRAYLGCGHTFAAGTVDAELAEAYRPGVC